MSLQSFSIKFSLNVVNLKTVLAEIVYLFLSCQHRTDWEKDLYVVVQRSRRVFKFFAGLDQTVCQVEKIMSVCVEGVEDVVDFDVDLQILQDNSDYPFDFLCRAYRK